MPEKIALLVSDMHLSHMAPLARSGEPDWYEAMTRPLRELRDLACDVQKLPVLCGGDLFEKWSCPPSLLTFAIEQLPCNFNSVMGQHDLPYHSWEHRKKSAFWTLVEAGIVDLASDWRSDGKTAWRGFQWGEEIESCERELDPDEDVVIAIAHQYVWWGNAKESAIATAENKMRPSAEKYQWYDVVLFGDNHKGFLDASTDCKMFNAGTFMRRHSDEKEYRPMVGILHEDGTVKPHYLDTSQDDFNSSEDVAEAELVLLNFDAFVEGLQKMGSAGLDFRRTVEAALDREQVSRGVKRVVLDAMEKSE